MVKFIFLAKSIKKLTLQLLSCTEVYTHRCCGAFFITLSKNLRILQERYETLSSKVSLVLLAKSIKKLTLKKFVLQIQMLIM